MSEKGFIWVTKDTYNTGSEQSLSHVRLCNSADCVLPGSLVHGTPQAGTLQCVAFPFSRGSSQPRDQTQLSCMAGGFFPSWTIREDQEYGSGKPVPSPGDLPDPGIKLRSPGRWMLYWLNIYIYIFIYYFMQLLGIIYFKYLYYLIFYFFPFITVDYLAFIPPPLFLNWCVYIYIYIKSI